MKIIFFGSDDFALAHLEVLLKAGHTVAACVTQPDKPKGRGLSTSISPIKVWAQGHNVPTLQPASLKDPEAVSLIKKINADIFVVIAYGQILPKNVLDIPPLGAVNVHGSLLPKYRGAAPINWAVINGDKITGLSIIQMNAGMDAGDILSQAKVEITGNDSAVSLRVKMIKEGQSLLLATIKDIEQRKVKPVKQNEKDVTFAPKLTKELGRIDWTKEAGQIHNLIRGLQPWPGGYSFFKGKLLKILDTEVKMQDISQAPGVIGSVERDGFTVACGKGALLVKNVHPESSKPMDAVTFLRGQRVGVGASFD